jgi:hypothetical protein
MKRYLWLLLLLPSLAFAATAMGPYGVFGGPIPSASLPLATSVPNNTYAFTTNMGLLYDNGSAWVAVSSGGSGTVTTTGSPASGNLATFSGALSITGGNLSGDCTTSGTLAVTCNDTNGSAFGTFATQNYATPPAIGATTPASGKFTTLITTGLVTVNGSVNINASNNGATVSINTGTANGLITLGGTADTTQLLSGNIDLGGANLTISTTAPTVSSGFGTSPSISHGASTASFSINVGTGGTASSGVVGLPAAVDAWSCFASDTGTTPTGQTEVTAGSTTTITVTNYSRTAGTPLAWTASEIIQLGCFAN